MTAVPDTATAWVRVDQLRPGDIVRIPMTEHFETIVAVYGAYVETADGGGDTHRYPWATDDHVTALITGAAS